MSQLASHSIPDIQGSADKRKIAINKVGIKDIRHPVVVKDRSDGQRRDLPGRVSLLAIVIQYSLAEIGIGDFDLFA